MGYKALFQDKDGKVVIFQRANIPLIVWLMSMIIARLTHGQTREHFQTLSFIAIITWALMEIFWGVNYFRRIIGLLVLLVVLAMRIR